MPDAKAPKCPVCGAPRLAEFRPFCSQRCAQVDLARWFGGAYAIPGEPADDAASETARAPDDPR
jgi:endogenous inhibitor of DNA gyrase (YacG/DUF329 family)